MFKVKCGYFHPLGSQLVTLPGLKIAEATSFMGMSCFQDMGTNKNSQGTLGGHTVLPTPGSFNRPWGLFRGRTPRPGTIPPHPKAVFA